MADLATLKIELDEVDQAIHALMVGKRETDVTLGGARVTYQQSSLPKLKEYRADLVNRIAALEGGLKRRRILVAY